MKFVDFCFNDIVSKKLNRLFGKAELSAAKRLLAFSTYYNHYNTGKGKSKQVYFRILRNKMNKKRGEK
jgi:hypothetical protein